MRVHRGIWGPGLGILPHGPVATRTARRQRPFSEPLPPLPPKTHHHSLSRLWVSVYCKGFLLFGSFFGYFPLSGGWGGRAPHAGLGACPFPRPVGPPPPPAYLDVSRSPGSALGVAIDCPAAPLGMPSPKPPAPSPSPVPGSPALLASQEMGVGVC